MMATSYFNGHLKNTLCLILLLAVVSCNNNSSKKATTENQRVSKDTSSSSPSKKKIILFFGNSLTAGYGVDPSEAYPALIQDKIDSLHLNYKVVNAGVSGETTADGNSRIEWILKQPIDIFVLELGGNDGASGNSFDRNPKKPSIYY